MQPQTQREQPSGAWIFPDRSHTTTPERFYAGFIYDGRAYLYSTVTSPAVAVLPAECL